jgi:peptidoglycan/xylan/chitin deacetylase (PgdA/CDA1 family)
MKFVSPVLKQWIYPALANTGYLRYHARSGQLSVLTYHGVRPAGFVSLDEALDGGLVSGENLRAQIRLLKKHYHVITPEDFRSWLENEQSLPSRSVLLTCDDGLRNVMTDMLPILQQENVRALFFITALSIQTAPAMLWYEELYLLLQRAAESSVQIQLEDFHAARSATENHRTFWWRLVKSLSARDAAFRSRILLSLHQAFPESSAFIADLKNDDIASRRFLLMDRDELRLLVAAGMTIGAHTVHHPVLSQCSDACAEAEISGSRAQLQSAIGQHIWAFAYPFGDVDSVSDRDLALARSANFSCAFMNVGGGFGAHLPGFALPRVHVTADMGLAEFEAHLSGFYRSLHPTETLKPIGTRRNQAAQFRGEPSS